MATKSGPPSSRSSFAFYLIPIIFISFFFSTFLDLNSLLALPLSLSSNLSLLRSNFSPPPIKSKPRSWLVSPPPPQPIREYRLELAWNKSFKLDGVEKSVISVNGLFPGPTIEARVDETVRITVINSLEETTALHWHGLRLPNEMDGTPGLTQCPIQPNGTRIYEFKISNTPGTYWYHSHLAQQRADGTFGAFIVHPGPAAVVEQIQHEDLKIRGRIIRRKSLEEKRSSSKELETRVEDRILMIGDWYHRPGKESFEFYHSMRSNGNEPVPDNTLVNGEQVYDCAKMLGDFNCRPELGSIPRYELDSTKSQKLRLINTGSLAIVYFSVDNHTLEVVEADGGSISPIFVKELSIAAGQRYSVFLHPDSIATAAGGNTNEFKFHTRLSQDCFSYRNPALEMNTYGFFTYSSSNPLSPTPLSPSAASRIVEFDALSLRSLGKPSVLPPTSREDIHLYVTTQAKVGRGRKPFGYVNGTSWEPQPLRPLLGYSADDRESKSWGRDQLVIPITTNDEVTYVDIIVNNLEDGTHPFHLHGFSFYPLYVFEATMGFGSYNWWNRPILPTHTPALRDTFLIPIRGHIIIRVPFSGKNAAGYYLFHCHVLMHSSIGMGVIFEVDGEKITDEQRAIARQDCPS